MVAHGWTASPAVEPAREPSLAGVGRFVDGLAALPGAEYVLAVDADGSRVLGEVGGPPGSALAVIGWVRQLAAVSHDRRRELEDLVLTTSSTYHLVRLVPSERHDDGVWVTVRIDRARGNLAWSRRALAGLGSPGSPTGPRALTAAPEPRSSAPSPSLPAAAAPAASGFQKATPASSPSSFPKTWAASAPSATAPAPRSAPSTTPASRNEPGPTTRPAPTNKPFEPFRPFEPSQPFTPFQPSPVRSTRSWPSPRTGPFPASPPADVFAPSEPPKDTATPMTGVTPAAMPGAAAPPEPDVDIPPQRPAGRDGSVRRPTNGRAARKDRQDREEPDPAGPEVVPPPPPPPVAEETADDAAEAEAPALVEPSVRPEPSIPAARESAENPEAPSVPAPRRTNLWAPVVVVPPPPSPVPEDDTTEMPAPMPYPIITAPPLEPDAPEEEPAADAEADELPVLPQRAPGTHLPAGLPTPRSVPTVRPAAAVAGAAAFTSEPSVLRRLIDGLRRLS